MNINGECCWLDSLASALDRWHYYRGKFVDVFMGEFRSNWKGLLAAYVVSALITLIVLA